MPPRTPLTHFLAIPLYNTSSIAALTASISDFARETTWPSTESESDAVGDKSVGASIGASNETGSSQKGIRLPPGSIRPPSTLHLTLGVMSLTTPEKIDLAVSMLKGLDLRDLLGSCGSSSAERWEDSKAGPLAITERADQQDLPLRIQLKGLYPMQDASATTVLYTAPHDRTNRLLPLCENLKAKFTEWCLLVPDKRELKLHATIVNTVYATDKSRGRRNGKERLKIDAQELIECWKDRIWAEVLVDKIVICEMGAKEDENGVLQYRELAESPLA